MQQKLEAYTQRLILDIMKMLLAYVNRYQHAHYYFCKAEEKVSSEDYKNQEAISEWKGECEKCIDALEKVKSKTYELI